MSTIDNRIVQMQFENSQFEKGAKQSMSTLEKLKSSLNFSNAKDSFADISNAANHVDLSGLQAGVEALQNRFSTWGIVGMQVISELTSSAINMGKRLADISIGQIMTGGKSRASNIQKAQMMLEGLFNYGTDAEGLAKTQSKVNQAMQDATASVNDTAFGLDQAALVASQLAASGVEMHEWSYDMSNGLEAVTNEGDKMTQTLLAVAGIASMTGTDYDRVGQIFTTVAGNGRLMSDQLLSFSSMGLNAAATLGQQMGKTESEIREMVSDGKISFDDFASAMYTAFGSQAKKANRTLTGVLSNCKAALSKIGADLWTPLIQNTSATGEGLVNFVQVMDKIREKLNDFRKAFSQPLGLNPDSTDSSKWGAWVTFVDNCCKMVRDDINSIDATKLGEQANKLATNALPKVWSAIKTVHDNLVNVGKAITDISKRLLARLDAAGINSKLYSLNVTIGRILGNLPKFDNILSGIRKVVYNLIYKTLSNGNLNSIHKGIKNLLYGVTNFQDALGKTNMTDIAKRIADGFSGAFTVLVKLFEKVTELAKPLGTILGKVSGYALEAAAKIGDFFSTLSENVSNSSLFEGFFNTLKGVFDKIASIDIHPMELLNDVINKFHDTCQKVVNGVKTIWENFVTFITPLLDQIKESFKNLFDSLSSPFSGNSNISALDVVNTFIKTLAAIKIASLADDLVNLFDKLGKSLETLNKNFKGISAGNFMKLAQSLLILAAAVFVLASIDGEKLKKSLEAMAVGIGELVAAFYALKGKNISSAKDAVSGKKGLAALGDSLADAIKAFSPNSMETIKTLAAALLILAAAIKILSTIGGEDMSRGLFGMAIAMIELWAITKAMSKIDTAGALKSAGSILLVSLSLLPIAGAIMALSLIDANKMYASMFALAIAIGAFGFVIGLMSNYGGDASGMIAAASSLLIVSLSLIPLVVALVVLSQFDYTTLGQSMAILWLSLGGFALIIGLLSVYGESAVDAIAAASSLLIVSLSLIPLVAALIALTFFDYGAISQSMGVLLTCVGGFALIIGLLSVYGESAVDAIAAASSILLVSLSLIPIVAALAILQSLVSKDMTSTLVSLVVLLAVIGVIATALADMSTDAVDALVAAAAFVVVSGAIIILVAALALLSAIDAGALFTNLTILGLAITALTVASPALELAASGIIAFAGSLAAMGGALIVVGLGIASCSGSMILFGIAVKTIADGVVSALTTVVNGIGGILSGIGNIFNQIWNALIDWIDYVINTVKSLLGIHSPSTVFSDIGENMMKGLLEGIKNLAGNVLSFLGELPGQMMDALGDLGSKALEAGANFMSGLLNGIKNGAMGILNYVGNLAGKMLSKVAKVFDSHSPSKETAKLGKYFDQGLVVGMKKYATDVEDAANSVGQSAMSGLNSVFDWTGVDSNPVITPVLDLSEIQNGSNSLASMMNQGYTYDAAATISGSFESPTAANTKSINKTMSTAMADLIAAQQQQAQDQTFTFNIPLDVNGRQIAKATRTYTQAELNNLSTIMNRKGGVRG